MYLDKNKTLLFRFRRFWQSFFNSFEIFTSEIKWHSIEALKVFQLSLKLNLREKVAP